MRRTAAAIKIVGARTIKPAIMILTVAACLSLSMSSIYAQPTIKPPPTPIHDVTNTYWGVTVHDPYRWLEDARSPQVSAWIDAQNAYANKILSQYPDSKRLVQRLRQLSLTGPQQFSPQLAGGKLFFLREVPPQQQPVLVVQPWPTGAQRVLVDTNPGGGFTAIEGFWPSPDGSYLAYATQSAGAEQTTIHVVQVANGRQLPDVLARAGGGTSLDTVAWDVDMRGFDYTRVPTPGTVPEGQESFNSYLWHHTLGKSQSADTVSLGKGFSAVAEWIALNSGDGRSAAAFVHYGDGAYNTVYLRTTDGWQSALTPDAGVLSGDNESLITTGAFVGNRFYVILTGGTQKGRIAEVADGAVRTIVPEDNWAMRFMAPTLGGFLVAEVNGPDWRVRQFTSGGRYVRTVALPQQGVGIDDLIGNDRSSYALITYQGWTIPETWVRYDSSNGSLTKIFAMKPRGDYSGVRFTRLDAISKDGLRVPVTVVYRKDIRPNGTAPGILTAYGGYGISTSPGFIGSTLAWIERGGVYAEANIRGGGEFGESWHLGGNLTHKQKVYDDFAAVAQLLQSSGWVQRGRLGIFGGSNGGLLMGAALTQHPELYRAVFSGSGIYDMLRVENDPNGAYNVSEYGSVKDETLFHVLYAYSPYHNVRNGVGYPAVLMSVGENDPRVSPYHSRKMIARLQAASSSPYPIILLTRRQQGHGIGASFSQRLGNRAARMIFFAQQLRLPR